MIPLLQTKTADTAHTGIFASVTRPSFLIFWVGPGDEASESPPIYCCVSQLSIFTADCLHHPIQMVGIEELHTLPVMNS